MFKSYLHVCKYSVPHKFLQLRNYNESSKWSLLLKTAHYTFSSPYDVHMHGAWLWEVDIFSMFYIQLKLRALLKISLNLEAFMGYPGIIFHINIMSFNHHFFQNRTIYYWCNLYMYKMYQYIYMYDDIYTKKMID